jgi:hypothetical protein
VKSHGFSSKIGAKVLWISCHRRHSTLSTIFREIEKITAVLSGMPNDHLGPQGTAIPDIEWYALGAIKKTASLSHAFCTLVRAKNTLSAAALVRLQLDTAM